MTEFVKWCINRKYQYLSNSCALLGHIKYVICDLSGLKWASLRRHSEEMFFPAARY